MVWPPANAIYRKETYDNYPGARAIMSAVYEGLLVPMDTALRIESRYFASVLRSPQAQAMIRDQLAWTSELAEWVAADERFEILAPHPLNLLCLALRAGDDATTALIEAANATGEVLFTRTVLGDRVALRFSIGARNTTLDHVRAAWRLLQELAT